MKKIILAVIAVALLATGVTMLVSNNIMLSVVGVVAIMAGGVPAKYVIDHSELLTNFMDED